MLKDLKCSKVILFGAGRGGIIWLNKLMRSGITPAYFVDNNKAGATVRFDYNSIIHTFLINTPESLLIENKAKLRIIITLETPYYEELEAQIEDMGLTECVFPSYVICCDWIATRLHLMFDHDILTFCCGSSNDFNDSRPEFPYFDNAEDTILNYMQKRDEILAELNNRTTIDISKPCLTCSRLKKINYIDISDKIEAINISCYPAICQAKCVYCEVYTDPQNTHEKAKSSHYPKMIAEMISYLEDTNLIDDKCVFIVTPAEITIMPHMDLILNAISAYRAAIATNGFLFEQKIADSLVKNGSQICVSIDSGSKETFRLVKGLDLFEKVTNNIIKYRSYGDVLLKYNIMAGVNDSEKDIDGFIDFLKSLGNQSMRLSFEYGLPLRTAFYPIVKFVERLRENGLTFSFHAYYEPSQIEGFIEQYYTDKHKDEFIELNAHLSKVFAEKYTDDYEGYRKYVWFAEICNMVSHFKDGTRFALLGPSTNEPYVLAAFNKLSLPLQTTELSFIESYEALRSNADIFILRNKRAYNAVKDFISRGGNDKRLIDIEKYFLSFEPAELFLRRRISKVYLKDSALVYDGE